MTLKKTPISSLLIFDAVVSYDSPANGVLATLKGYATLSNDKSNKNKHFYPTGFWASVLDNNEFVAGRMLAKAFYGDYRHPKKEEDPIPQYGGISHNIRDYRVDDKGVFVVIDVLDTEHGRDLLPLIKYGSKIGISTRAYGTADVDENGYTTPKLDEYLFITWDLVSLPAFDETRLETVNDSYGVALATADITELSKDKYMDGLKGLCINDAKSICNYSGLDFTEIADSFTQPVDAKVLEDALDQAMLTIRTLEADVASYKAKQTPPVVTEPIPVNDAAVVGLMRDRLTDSAGVVSALQDKLSLAKYLLSENMAYTQTLEDSAAELVSNIEELNSLNDTYVLMNTELEKRIKE